MKKVQLGILAVVIVLAAGLTHLLASNSGSRASAQATDIQDVHAGKVSISYNQNVPSNFNWGLQYIPWDQVQWNVDSEYNATNPDRLTAQLSGYYLIQAHLGFQPGFKGDVYLGLLKNGVLKAQKSVGANGGVYPTLEISTVDNLAPGDYYTVAAGQTSGVTRQTNNTQMSFSMTLLSH